MLPRTVSTLLALLVLVPGAVRADERTMASRTYEEMISAQNLTLQLQELTGKVTPEVAARDPKLLSDIAALRLRVGLAYENMRDQRSRLLGTDVPGSPDVINDQLKNWTSRKSAMVMQTLLATGARNKYRMINLHIEGLRLETRVIDARHAARQALPPTANVPPAASDANPIALLGRTSQAQDPAH